MRWQKVKFIGISVLIGLLIPTVFISLDLQQLEMKPSLENIIWIVNSQNALLFIIFGLPLISAALGYLILKLKEINQEIISSHKKLEEEKKKTELSSRLALVGELAAGIAHEINNPLTIISGYAKIIDEEAKKESFTSVPLMAPKIIKAVERTTKIIESLKKISRDVGDDENERITIEDLVQDSMGLTEMRLKDFGIKVQTELSPGLFVEGKLIQLSQVLINLITNSLHAIQENEEKWIRVISSQEDKKVLLRVLDSGMGIPSEILEKIFNPFYTSKEVGLGTGLGLSISKTIMTDHGGDLIYQLYEGHTSFVMEFPHGQ